MSSRMGKAAARSWRGLATVAASMLLTGGAGAGKLLDEHALGEEAARLELRLGGRSMTASKAERQLSAPIRDALNTWAAEIAALDLEVVVPEQGQCLLLGRCDRKLLDETAGQVDQAWELIEPLRPADDPWDDAVVAFLFDEPGARSPAWSGVLDALVARGLLEAEGAAHLRDDPGSLTMRQVPAFLQPTWDVAGNAAAGDDEFRLGNEVVNKLVQCVLTERYGHLPDTVRWGLGYVAEQRLFRMIYQFDGSGFVASADHFDWPKRTAAKLKELAKDKGFSLAELALTGAGGRAETPQQVTWAALDHQLHRDPEGLAAMLTSLTELHAKVGPYRGGFGYAGDRDKTRAVLAEHLDAIDVGDLVKHLKRVK